MADIKTNSSPIKTFVIGAFIIFLKLDFSCRLYGYVLESDTLPTYGSDFDSDESEN